MAGGLRERKKDQTRTAIRDAGLAVFIEQGYDQTIVRAIAQGAGISERTFYRYFDSKEEVLLAPTADYFAEVEEVMRSRPADESPMASYFAVREALEPQWSLGDTLTWLSDMINDHPPVRAQFLVMLYDHHDWLVKHFAERMGVAESDMRPWLYASCGIATLLESISLHGRTDESRSSWDHGDALLVQLCVGVDPDAVPERLRVHE